MANASNSGTPDKPSREDRLAAKLRENLRRRKAQARAGSAQEGSSPPARGQQDVDEIRHPVTALPKGAVKS